MQDKMYSYVEDNPIDLYVNYDDSLTNEQVNKILAGESDEVRWDIELDANDNMYETELDGYWADMCSDLGCTIEEVEEWLTTSDSIYPSYELDDHGWRQLMGNTQVCITATVWDAEFNFNNWAYGGPVNYSDVKETLKLLGVNPKEFRDLKTGGSMSGGDKLQGWFPDMPKRVPVIDPKDLWDNLITLYDGVMNFCLGDLEDAAEVMSSDSKNIKIKKGTNIVFYNFGNGAGITETVLIEDLIIPRKKVDFRNDKDNSYGVQECYGFTHSFWSEGAVHNAK